MDLGASVLLGWNSSTFRLRPRVTELINDAGRYFALLVDRWCVGGSFLILMTLTMQRNTSTMFTVAAIVRRWNVDDKS